MNKQMTIDTLWNELKESSPEEKDIIEVSQEVSAIIENIVEARIKSGLTQRDLAKLCGIKQSAIARMEKIQVIPRLDTLIKIARKIGIKIGTSIAESSFEYIMITPYYCTDNRVYDWNSTLNKTNSIAYEG